MNTQDMPAGRKMDALVAEKVMGLELYHLPAQWAEGSTPDGEDGWDGFFCPRCGTPEVMYSDSPCCKYYSASIACAWEVVEHFTGEDCKEQDFFIECWSDGEWFVAFHPVGYSSRSPKAWCDGKITGSPSAPLAICRAALMAVGGDR